MNSDQQKVWSLMADLDYCMLVTRVGQRMRSRPMSSIVDRSDGRVYFLCHAEAIKDEEIEANPYVLLDYTDGKSTFVSTAATATIVRDKDLVRRLWNGGAQAFWPEGPDDEDIVVIVATPKEAEYWDGPNAVVSAARFTFALATGTKPDMGKEGKVKM